MVLWMKEYYQRRAREYDQTSYQETGESSPELLELQGILGALKPMRTLDVACGTGYLTRSLQGRITCVDFSSDMLMLARQRLPLASFLRADVPPLPFADWSFRRVFTGHFYGHLEEGPRQSFLREARRVGRDELIVVDSAVQSEYPVEYWDERELLDGSRFVIWKRHFTPHGLAEEVGADRVLFAGPTFVAVAARLHGP
jgi:ubiquinone/menaquinone biosynthesis C-methylase UbiE